MGDQSRDSAQEQTTKAQKITGMAQPPIITSIHIYNVGDDCTIDGYPTFPSNFQGLLNNYSCHIIPVFENLEGLLKLTWNQLSSGGEYILNIYNYADQEGVVYTYKDGEVSDAAGVVTDTNPIFARVIFIGDDYAKSCKDIYWVEIINVKDGQTVKSTRMSFNW